MLIGLDEVDDQMNRCIGCEVEDVMYDDMHDNVNNIGVKDSMIEFVKRWNRAIYTNID